MGSWWSSQNTDDTKDKEIAALQKINEQLRNDIRALRLDVLRQRNDDGNNTKKQKTLVSREWVMAWVDEQLTRPGSNIGWIPDAVERRLKTDIFVMMLDFIDHFFETTTIQTMNHQINIDIVPLQTQTHD